MELSKCNPQDNLGELKEDQEGEYHLTLSSGSPAALLAGLGTLLACWAAGIKKFRTIGGVSAGAIVASLSASGQSPVQLLHRLLRLNFNAEISPLNDLMLLWHGLSEWNSGRYSWPLLPSDPWRYTGLLSTRAVGYRVYQAATAGGESPLIWPEHFWTLATLADGSPVLFKKDGAYLLRPNGPAVRLSDEPPELPLAIRMSCTIPIVMAALQYKGRFMFDGALSRDGVCPVGIPIRHFGVQARKIIACFLGDDSNDPLAGTYHSLCRASWGVDHRREWGPETAGVIAFYPQITHLHSLKFRLTDDEKWLAVLLAFEACAARLALEGILDGANREKVASMFADLGNWRSLLLSAPGRPQLLAERAKSCLREYGFY